MTLLTDPELTVAAAAIGITEAKPARFDAGVRTYSIFAGKVVAARFRTWAGMSGRIATVVAARGNCVFCTECHHDGNDKSELGSTR